MPLHCSDVYRGTHLAYEMSGDGEKIRRAEKCQPKRWSRQ